jgi:hypothetical protein
MRKGLALLLGTLAFALIGANTFAKAPVIGGVPDVIIGDEEDGLTIDNNWFRYVNAFNLLDYVSDEDSTPSTDLMYVFLEENSYNNIRINDMGPIDAADFDNPAAWGPNEITGFGGTRNFLLSFWDVLRSDPATQAPNPPYWPNPLDVNGDEVTSDQQELLPWQTVEGTPSTLGGDKRLVTLFAADEFDNIDTDTLFVMSMNAGFDDVNPEVTTIFEDSFPNGAGTLWVYNSVAALPAATSGQTGDGTSGYLSIQSGLTATGTLGAWSNVFWGRWQLNNGYEGAIAHADGDVMFRANMTLRQDQASVDVTPRIRFGAIQAAETQAIVNMTAVIPNAGANPEQINPQVPAQGVQQNFTTCWSANSGSPGFGDLLWDTGGPLGVVDLRGWNCFYDVFDNQDSQAGTWYMDHLLVETIPTPAAVTPAYTATDFTGWPVQKNATGAQMTQTDLPGGGVTFNDPGISGADRNYYLILDPTGITWAANQTLRVNVELSCPTASDRTNFHRFRLRTYSGYYHVSQEWILAGDDGGLLDEVGMASMPPVGSTYTYSTYVQPNGGPTPELAGIAGATDMTVALDQLHRVIQADGAAQQTHTLATATTVHEVSIELLNIADVY